MRIVHLSAEFAPLAKIGGLADAVYGLAAFQAKNCDVEVIIPKYESIATKYLKDAKLETKTLKCVEKTIFHDNSIWSLNFQGIKLKLVEPYNHEKYFARSNVYGYEDDNARFLYFTRTALQLLNEGKEDIDILHVHDWHTAIAFLMLRELYPELQKKIKGKVLTIHNLAFQGKCPPHNFQDIGLNAEKLLADQNLKDDYCNRTFNILKGAIYLADAVTTVSPTYAKEIETKTYGCGLEEHIFKNRHKIFGILNGIDYSTWNPANSSISYNSEMDPKEIIAAKEKTKIVLGNRLSVSFSGPLFACVTRLSHQKGHTLIKHAIIKALQLKGNFILLGSFSCPRIEKEYRSLKIRLAVNSKVSLNFGYDPELANEIYASADFILMPSIYEPCGLAQLIAMRYGTIPIARKTGGLADTVFEKEKGKGNGYLFQNIDIKEMKMAMQRALDDWDKPEIRAKIIKNDMKEDHSWEKSGKEYLSLYETLLGI